MQPSLLDACPKPGSIGRVVAGRASGIKMVEMMESGAPIVRMGWCQSQSDGVCASVIFPLHHKTQKMACITPQTPPHKW